MSTNGKPLTIDQILDADDIDIEKVDTPRWGGYVYVRTLPGFARDAFDLRAQEGEFANVRASLVAACMCDEDGKLLKPSESQVEALGRKSSAMLDRCVEACQRVNLMASGDVERLEKNLPAEAASGSG